MSYVIYKISGTITDRVYIGYCDKQYNILDHFMVGATRKDERCDVAFVQSQSGGGLTVEVLAERDDESDALFERNRLRSTTPASFSGPTNWPSHVHKMLSASAAQANDKTFVVWRARQQPTARGAYESGLWSYIQIKQLSHAHGSKQIIDDMATLTPFQFEVKYADQLSED